MRSSIATLLSEKSLDETLIKNFLWKGDFGNRNVRFNVRNEPYILRTLINYSRNENVLKEVMIDDYRKKLIDKLEIVRNSIRDLNYYTGRHLFDDIDDL